MRSFISRKGRKNESEVNEANKRGIFFGCCGMCSGCWASDSSKTLTSFTVSFDSNRIISNFDGKKLPGESDTKENGSIFVERCPAVKDELRSDNLAFTSTFCSRDWLSQSILPSSTRFTSLTTSFEPTPITQVLPQLYLGNEQDAQEAEKLIGLGITHVISLVGTGRYNDLYPKHMYIPLLDNGGSNLLAKIDNSWDFAMESQKPGNKLFVHCQLGQNRSASFVIGFLMKSKNLSFHEAYTLLKKKRQLIHPHKKYIEQLRQLDLELHKVYSTPTKFLDIERCSKEGIKIMYHNFSKADSEKYKTTQIRKVEEFDNDLWSITSAGSQDRLCDVSLVSSIYLPYCDDIQNTSWNPVIPKDMFSN